MFIYSLAWCFISPQLCSVFWLQAGVYKVRGEGETAGPAAAGMRVFSATVVFLDDSTHCFSLDKKAKGGELLGLVTQHLELSERDYFGLVFTESCVPLPGGHAPDVTRWLDPAKSVRKQMRVKVSQGAGECEECSSVTMCRASPPSLSTSASSST